MTLDGLRREAGEIEDRAARLAAGLEEHGIDGGHARIALDAMRLLDRVLSLLDTVGGLPALAAPARGGGRARARRPRRPKAAPTSDSEDGPQAEIAAVAVVAPVAPPAPPALLLPLPSAAPCDAPDDDEDHVVGLDVAVDDVQTREVGQLGRKSPDGSAGVSGTSGLAPTAMGRIGEKSTVLAPPPDPLARERLADWAAAALDGYEDEIPDVPTYRLVRGFTKRARGDVRPQSIGVARIRSEVRKARRLGVRTLSDGERPRTRGECAGAERPCPFVGCRQNLYLDVTDSGSLKFNFPDREPWEMDERWSCALDVADRGATEGGAILDRVAEAMGMTKERVRQIEVTACAKAKDALAALDVLEAEISAAESRAA